MSIMADTMAHGATAVNELFQSGVKGMKWGVRKDPGHEGERVKTKKLDKLDSKWEKSIYSMGGAVAVHNAMAEHFNARIGGINDRHPHADIVQRPDSPESKAYMAEVTAMENKAYGIAVTSVHGVNPSGKKEAVFVDDDKGARIEVRDVAVKHADEEDVEPNLIILLKQDSQGRFTEANMAELEVAHSDGSKNFLAHYGKKGMKWGVRTVDRASSPTLQKEKDMKVMNTKDVTVTQRKPGKFVKTSGGQRQKASDDAVKAHAGRQKAKKSTTDALSNDELKATIERMRLEQDFHKLDSKVKRRGQSFAARLFASPGARKVGADLAKRIAETP